MTSNKYKSRLFRHSYSQKELILLQLQELDATERENNLRRKKNASNGYTLKN